MKRTLPQKQTAILTGDISISYREYGNKNNPNILFLHGYAFSGIVFDEVAWELVDKFHMILIDIPGFGSSDSVKNFGDYTDYACCISQFIEIIIGKPVILIGHSFGGGIGLMLSSKYPEQVKMLILVDSAGIPMKKPRIILAIIKCVEMCLQLASPKGFFSSLFLLKVAFTNTLKHPVAMWRSLELPNKIDLTPLMSTIHIPTLIMWAQKDMMLSVDKAITMTNLLPNSRLIFAPANFYHDWCVTHSKDFVNLLLPRIKIDI